MRHGVRQAPYWIGDKLFAKIRYKDIIKIAEDCVQRQKVSDRDRDPALGKRKRSGSPCFEEKVTRANGIRMALIERLDSNFGHSDNSGDEDDEDQN